MVSKKKNIKQTSSSVVIDEDFSDEVFVEDIDYSKRKKIFIIVTGFILLLLMTSYFILAPIQGVVFGQLNSQPLDNNFLISDFAKIYFTDDIAKELSFLYSNEQIFKAVETSVCLQGKKANGEYYIDNLIYPLIIHQTYTEVSFNACPDETLIMLHTHPYKNCRASSVDIKTLKERKEFNENLLMIIMCENNRFAIYS